MKFSLVEPGIVNDYDSFNFKVEIGNGFIEIGLISEKNGIETLNTELDFNHAILYGLVEKLRAGAEQRGDCWNSFVMSYKVDGQVKMSFQYDQS